MSGGDGGGAGGFRPINEDAAVALRTNVPNVIRINAFMRADWPRIDFS